jgi:hypothetical protein
MQFACKTFPALTIPLIPVALKHEIGVAQSYTLTATDIQYKAVCQACKPLFIGSIPIAASKHLQQLKDSRFLGFTYI